MLLLTLLLIYFKKNEWVETMIYSLIGLIFAPIFFSRISYGIWIIIFSVPISLGVILPIVGVKMSIPAEFLSGILLIVFVVKWLAGLPIDNRLLKHPITLLFAVDLAWSFISATQSELSEVAMKRFAMKFLFLAVFYFIFATQLTSVKRQKMLYWLYGLGMLYPIYHTISVHARRGFGHNTAANASEPFYADHTIYGAVLAFILPFFMMQVLKRSGNSSSLKFGAFLMVIILVIAEFLSYSRASWISLLAAGGLLALLHFKIKSWQLISLISIMVIGVLVNLSSIYGVLKENEAKYGDDVGTHLTSVTNLQNDQSNLERVNRWVCAYRMFEDKPILGFGPGTYQFVYDRYQTPEFMTRISTHKGDRGNAHSEYLTYLSELGLPGLVVFILIVLSVLNLGVRLYHYSFSVEERNMIIIAILGLVTFFVHGLFNTFSDMEKMSVLIYGSVGILVHYDLKKNELSETI